MIFSADTCHGDNFPSKINKDLNGGSFVDVMLNIVGFMSILPPEKAKIDNFW